MKAALKAADPRKRDFAPTLLDFGTVRILLARHFGFCFGVEHAIEQAYRAIEENPGKRIFLLSKMIHNPEVNDDLECQGIRFLMDTGGNVLLPFIISRDVRLQGVTVGPQQDMARMCRAIESTKMRPVVDSVFAFEDAQKAYAHLAEAGHFGKVCIAIGDA